MAAERGDIIFLFSASVWAWDTHTVYKQAFRSIKDNLFLQHSSSKTHSMTQHNIVSEDNILASFMDPTEVQQH